METRKLNNGVEMPQEGFGVFQVNDPALCEQTVLDAIHTGYRLIDTASSYENEEAVGRAIQRSGVSREELFITTKAYIHQMGYDNTIAAFEESLKKLGLEYLDGGPWRNCTGREKCGPSESATSSRTGCWIFA